ncbi:enolase C-terminal domain-like protein [Jiangella gansuensis]|uniref:enolase C-terminal domain-like protein n=1 Tax=Jiangella gansuensis TaxID=281473 RepID=UPI00047B3592|nr:enolase C-terminal domain-like protein [Jiangella gansuensis]
MTGTRRLDTDVDVLDARVTFSPIELGRPFAISGRTIAWFTMAVVEVDVRDRLGTVASGRGATILSVPWAWPRSELSVERRDQVLRALTARLADDACAAPPSDPIRRWLDAHATLAETAAKVAAAAGGVDPVPSLAALLALGAVDNAVHDGWARAAGRPAHTMYTGRYLHDDLGVVSGGRMSGRWPGDFLVPARSRVPVQHVVGVGDPLEPAETADGERSLREWLGADGVRHLKVKVRGADVDDDARRIEAVWRLGHGLGVDVALAVDPNEGYESAADVFRLLDVLERSAPAARRALAYVEQPVPRDATPDPDGLTRVGRLAPVVMDEGLVDPRAVHGLRERGWSGVAIKAGKGHSAALLAHAVAKAAGLYVTVQDLTAVDLAFVHSARLVSLLDLPSPHLEYNSRQYAPAANQALGGVWPDLTTVRDGGVTVPPPSQPGLY